MKYEASPEQLLDEVTKGLAYRKRYAMEESWNTLERLMNHDLQGTDADGNPGPNIIASNADSLLSSLNVNDPYLTVKARKMAHLVKANLVENQANYLLKRLEIDEEVDAAILCAYLYGRGFIKEGYDSEFGFDTRFDVGPDEPWGMTLTSLNLKTQTRNEDLDVDPGMPWARMVLPHDIVVPWGTRDLKSCPVIFHRILRHIDDIKADPKYENKKDLKPTMTRQEFHESYERALQLYRLGSQTIIAPYLKSARKEDKDPCYVELWEIHDRRTRRVMVVAHDHKKFLRNQPDLLQINGKLPFTSICFQPRTRNFWTTPDAFYLKYHQFELTDIAIQRSKKRKLDVPKGLLREDAFDEVQIKALSSSRVGAFVKVKGDQPLSESVMLFSPQAPNQNLMIEEENIRRNSRELVGFSRNQMGEFESAGRRTATEASIVQQASDLRLDRRQKQVKKLYTETLQRVLWFCFRFWKIPKVMEILGEDGATEYYSVTGQDLEGDYDYDLGFSVGANESLQQRRSNALGFYQIAAQDPLADPVEVRRFVVQAMNDPRFTKIFARSLNGQPQQIPQGPQGQTSLAGLSVGGGQTGSNTASTG